MCSCMVSLPLWLVLGLRRSKFRNLKSHRQQLSTLCARACVLPAVLSPSLPCKHSTRSFLPTMLVDDRLPAMGRRRPVPSETSTREASPVNSSNPSGQLLYAKLSPTARRRHSGVGKDEGGVQSEVLGTVRQAQDVVKEPRRARPAVAPTPSWTSWYEQAWNFFSGEAETATDVEDASEGDAGGLATAVSTVLDQAESALLQSVGGILGTFIEVRPSSKALRAALESRAVPCGATVDKLGDDSDDAACTSSGRHTDFSGSMGRVDDGGEDDDATWTHDGDSRAAAFSAGARVAPMTPSPSAASQGRSDPSPAASPARVASPSSLADACSPGTLALKRLIAQRDAEIAQLRQELERGVAAESDREREDVAEAQRSTDMMVSQVESLLARQEEMRREISTLRRENDGLQQLLFHALAAVERMQAGSVPAGDDGRGAESASGALLAAADRLSQHGARPLEGGALPVGVASE